MAKKLSAIHKSFNPAAKAGRAVARAEATLAQSAAKAAREKLLDESIFPPDSEVAYLMGSPNECTVNRLDERIISLIQFSEVGATVNFMDEKRSQVTLRNYDACKALMTNRAVVTACLHRDGAIHLANKARLLDAEAEGQRIAAVSQPGLSKLSSAVRL